MAFRWGDGRGKVHSISRRTHEQHVHGLARRRRNAKNAQQNAQLDDPNQITQPLTPRLENKELGAAVREKFGPTEQALAGQQRVSGQQQQNITDWFGQYQNAVKAATANQAAYQKGIEDAQAQQAQQAQATDTTAAQGVSNSGEAAQAAAARRTSENSFGAMLRAQGGAEHGYLNSLAPIGAGEAASEHLKEAGNAKNILAQIADLVKQKGDFKTTYRANARDTERRNAQANAAFGLDQQKAQADVALKEQVQASLEGDKKKQRGIERQRVQNQRMQSDRQFKLDQQKYGDTKAKDRYQRKHGLGPYKPASGGGTKGMTPAQLRAARAKSGKALDRLDTARSDYGRLAGTTVTDNVTKAQRKPSQAEITQRLRDEGFSANEIHLAILLRSGKKWGRHEVQMAHRLGILHIPRNYVDTSTPRSSLPNVQNAPDGHGGSRPT